MVLDGATIYNDGVGITHDYEEKIRQIVNTVKNLSPSSEVSLRLLKSGRVYEGLLWGNASNTPIGAYNRGPSMAHVLDNLYKRVKRDCIKIRKVKGKLSQLKTSPDQSLAMAG